MARGDGVEPRTSGTYLIITDGFGVFSNVKYVITDGYSIASSVAGNQTVFGLESGMDSIMFGGQVVR